MPESRMKIHANVPWYRQPWPWILFGLPGIAVIASITTLVIAVRTDDALVADDYYKAGLGINRTLARVERAAAMGLTGDLTIQGGGALLRLQANTGVALPQSLHLRITHPTRPELDQMIEMNLAPDGFRGILNPLSAGRWQFHVEDANNSWRLAKEAVLPAEAPIHFQSKT